MALPGQPLADAADPTDAPRPATERALAGLAAWLEGPVSTAAVAGAPGAGTTFVLRCLERRERERRRVLFSPFLHMEAEAVERWLDGLAFASTRISLEAWLAGAPDAPPLLLVDEAHAAPGATLEALARLRETRAPHLRICLGGCAGPALEHAARSVGGAEAMVFQLPPWSLDELRALAEALCARGERDSTPLALDPVALLAAAEECPGLLRHAWSALREGRTLPTPAPSAALATRAPSGDAATTPAAPVTPAAPAATTTAAAPAPAASVSTRVLDPPRSPPPSRRLPTPPPRPRPPPPAARPLHQRVPWFQLAALGVGFSLGFAGGWRGWHDLTPTPRAGPTPAAVAAAPPAAPTAELHDVQVNALPWAWIRIDGQHVGVTPLVHRALEGGEHEFEATFPDGRQQRRTVEIGPDSRFVSFPE